ncbi:MAG: rhodanese-like domain-containing protein [bacterium]
MTRKRTVTLLLAGFSTLGLLVASSSAHAKAGAGAGAGAKTVHRTIGAKTAHDYWRFHKETKFQYFGIIDLRTPKQFARGRIPGAQNIPADKRLRFKLYKLSKKKAYLIYCRNGKTGRQTLALMKKLRFKEVYNIADGIIAWKRQKYPIKRGTGND